MESPNSNHDDLNGRPHTTSVYAVYYSGRGRYALDHLNAGVKPRRLRDARSLKVIQTELKRIQQPGDVVVMSEALRAMQLLELPCRRLSRMQSQLGEQDLFAIHGEVGIIPLPGTDLEAIRGSVQVNHPPQGSPSPNRIKDILSGERDADEGDDRHRNN